MTYFSQAQLSSVPFHFAVNSTAKPAKLSNRPLINKHVSNSVLPSSDTHTHTTLRTYSQMLQNCTSNGFLFQGKCVHAKLLRTGIDPDTHLYDCFINLYSNFHKVEYAHSLFDAMPHRDVVAYTALMKGYNLVNNGREGVRLYFEMKREKMFTNGFAHAACLKACALCLDLEFGKQVHAEVIKLQSLSDLFIGSSLVDMYVKCGEISLAERCFFSLPKRNGVAMNVLLNGYSQMGNEHKVLKVFSQLEEIELRTSKFMLSIVIGSCINLGESKYNYGRSVHCLMVKLGLELDGFLGNNLIDLYSKFGTSWDAYNVFLKIKAPDIVVWTTMISCFVKQGLWAQAVELFVKVCKMGIKPNHFTLSSLAKAASEMNDQRFCTNVHSCIVKRGFSTNVAVLNAALDMYMKCGFVEEGIKVFRTIGDHDIISWNLLLSGFHMNGSFKEALKHFNQMLIENAHVANMYTFIAILRSSATLKEASHGAQVHTHTIKHNLESDSFIGKALLDMYINCDLLDNALTIFNRLKNRDVFTWTTIISKLTTNLEGEKALKHLQQMQRESIAPNEFTIASCLRACSDLASLDTGAQLHAYSIKSGHIDHSFVTSAIVDLYIKCGCLNKAVDIFSNSSATRDVISWNTIICGYSQYGNGIKALEAFECMLKQGKLPDEVTFIGILSACSHHEKLLDLGKQYFEDMSSVYRVGRTIEHYACMVNILARAGKLEEAESFVSEMCIPPNALIWQTILGACRTHGNIELGEKAAKKLFELEPNMDSHYILLSNAYASCHRWGDVAKTRSMMSKRGVKKEPGCSWIENKGKVHVFLAKDHSHPMAEEIYAKVKELTHEITRLGYAPNIEHALRKVDDDEKRESLVYHSERLALAYGLLISTESENTIRIFKNLRICGDCHNAFKLLSIVAGREIVIRDVTRFHRFRDGSCSCHDYW